VLGHVHIVNDSAIVLDDDGDEGNDGENETGYNSADTEECEFEA
jgi:hypothetical protein